MRATLAGPFPIGAEAQEPPEERTGRRDSVRLLVSRPGAATAHAAFTELPRFVVPGDILVINTSATWAASLDTRGPGDLPMRVQLATPLQGGEWLIEPRVPDGASSKPLAADLNGITLPLSEGGTIQVLGRFRDSRRLWVARVEFPGSVPGYLSRWGRPIRYGYVDREWPIGAYQTVFARIPGSAEMPSAGRPFTSQLIAGLVAGGIGVVPLVLHTGVSSLEGDEAPYPEWYSIPEATARAVNATREAGGRVIAVGTTVVRALESAGEAGHLLPGAGWTDLVVTPDRGVSVVDALITGLHDPRASHLQMLRAFAPEGVLREAYGEARDRGYLWHEFGDSHLIFRHG